MKGPALRYPLFAACVLLAACDGSKQVSRGNGSTQPPPPDGSTQAAPGAEASKPPRVVAIGDLHGDVAATRAALRLAGALGDGDVWIGGDLAVVQIGDQLSRGDDEPEILALLAGLAGQASAAGGALVSLDGNHELLNVAGDFRYATPDGLADYGGTEGRRQAFAPGSAQARAFADRPLVEIRAETVFVHAGLFPEHLDAGLDALEQELDAWLRGGSAVVPRVHRDPESPVWTRRLGEDPTPADCDAVRAVLGRLGVKRMVIGHTVQPHINATCGGLVWRVDVGLSRHYGGPIEVLVIEGDQVSTRSAPRPN